MPETQQSNSNGANMMTTIPMTVRELMVRPPEPLKVFENRDNLPAAWKTRKQMWQHYTVVTEMENSSRNDNQKKSFSYVPSFPMPESALLDSAPEML